MIMHKLLKELNLFSGTALVFENDSLTYEHLLERIDNLAAAILHFAPQQEIIGVSATRCIEMVVGVLAILKAGKAYLPLDPKYPTARIAQLTDDSGIQYMVCVATEKEFYHSFGLQVIAADITYNFPLQKPTLQSDIVCVLYTSGSTGVPKGVCLGHKGLMNQLDLQKSHGHARPGVRTLQFSHLSFDGSFLEIFVPLYTGGTLYLVNESYRTNIGKLLHYIVDNSINRMFLAYVVVQYLAETAQQYALYPTSLKEIITGGELLRITPQIANFFHKLNDCVFMNVYGPTEASVWVTEHKLVGNAPAWPAIPPIGKPVPIAEVYVVDEQHNLLPTGETGEVIIAGDCLALYYLNKPEETAKRFINWQLPDGSSKRVYKTGDHACFNTDGTIQFQGRIDNQVKVKGGYRVELSEIEVVISNVEGVSQVKAIVREDRPTLKKIVAYVIVNNKQLSEKDLKQKVDAQLPAYMAPDAYVIMDIFPYTVSGKIDTMALPAPEKTAAITNPDKEQPTGAVEHYLITLWEDILNVKGISVNDDFFYLGGSSLMAIEMIARIEREQNLELSIASVYDFKTIKKLARLIAGDETPPEFSPLVAIKATGNRPPVYFISGDNLNVINFNGIVKYINEQQPAYGLQPKGVDGKSQPLESIEDIAKFYVDAIVGQDPIGPYAIVGYSFGGYVAFEMAMQLKKQHKAVKLLGMIDTDAAMAVKKKTGLALLSQKVLRQFPKFIWIAKSFIKSPARVIAYQKHTLRQRFKEKYDNNEQKEAEAPTNFHKLRNKIIAVHHRALANYCLAKYDGRITLFRAKERPYFVDDFEYLGWRNHTTAGVDVYITPGDHDSIFLEPNCKKLAEQIDAALVKV
jgi:amino acid adenylation domain-containing protein